MTATRITINHAEIQSYLDGDHGVRALLLPYAGRVAQALRDDPHDDTGAFQDGITIEEEHTDRMVLRIGSTDFKGAILEANYGLHSRALDSA